MNKEIRSISVKNFLREWMILGLFGLLIGCAPGGISGEEAEPSVDSEQSVSVATPQIDDETGLELNPAVIPAGEFVVIGEITSVNLIPQDAPLIKIATEDGQSYQILAQPVPQIMYEDGTAVPALDIKNGLQIRATVQQNDTGGLGGEPVFSSTNLTILLPTDE